MGYAQLVDAMLPHPEPTVATVNNMPAALTTLLQVPIDEVVHLIAGEHLWLLLAMVFGHGSLCATRPITRNSSCRPNLELSLPLTGVQACLPMLLHPAASWLQM